MPIVVTGVERPVNLIGEREGFQASGACYLLRGRYLIPRMERAAKFAW